MESDLGKLFIGGISWDTDEERLNEYFTKYGEVVEAVIMRDRATGRARGFGFVVFADPAVAGRVIMDKHVIDGRTVEAKKAVPRDDQHILNRNISTNSPGPGRTKKIFVGGLASTVTETDFKNYFEQYGNITDVVVMYDHNTQRPRGFGFITYDSEEAVDRVLHKTFHELNGKMVEVKRAVPKELSPGLSRSPLMGYGYGLNRPSSFLNAYAQVGEFGMRVDGRFNPLPNNRSGFSPFGTTGYGMGVNLEPGLSPTYNGGSNFGSSPVYGRMLSPYSNRYNTPVGYSAGSARNDPALSITSRNVWGNGGLIASSNQSSNTGAFVGSGSGVFGGSLGNRGGSWGPSSVSAQVGGNASAYNNSTREHSYELGGTAGYGRNVGLNVAPSSSFDGVNANYEGSYGDFYRSNSVYGDSTWRSPTPELDGSGSLGYGLGSIGSDATVKTSEGYIGSYGVTNRQPNRGTTF
ncbi:Heterogeneous nuclear ribonucleoprotein 1 [Linum perenne]